MWTEPYLESQYQSAVLYLRTIVLVVTLSIMGALTFALIRAWREWRRP